MITKQHLRKVWKNETKVSEDYLVIISKELSMKISECKLDSELRLSHFVAQLAKEVGPGMRMEEPELFSSRIEKHFQSLSE